MPTALEATKTANAGLCPAFAVTLFVSHSFRQFRRQAINYSALVSLASEDLLVSSQRMVAICRTLVQDP